jgi:drebrin-like protein
VVQYDYKKAEDNEIDLVLGEHVTGIDQLDESWWAGVNSKGELGLFPSNYVELLEDAGPTATALYDYEAAEDNELSFAEGVKITGLVSISELDADLQLMLY